MPFTLYIVQNLCTVACSLSFFSPFPLHSHGQLGNGTRISSLCPVRMGEGTAMDDAHVEAIAAGARHSLLLCRDGSAWACGHGAFGALGTDSKTDALRPERVAAKGKVVGVAAGWWHSLFLAEDDSA
jgi:alpha-tubulin suppressor-like RCC1 family protein